MIAFLKKRKWTFLLLGVLVIAIGVTLWFFSGLNRALVSPEPSRLILDRAGRYLGEVPASDGNLGYWPLPAVLPEKIATATLETEDRHFYDHDGVHVPSVFRAMIQNIQSGRVVSGASTIAMQVARMQDPGSRNILRKVCEAAEAIGLVDENGHDKVLRHYLAIAPYGNRVHGASRAARYYFDKPVEDLSWLQAAFLAGLPQAPGRLDPHKPLGLWRATRRAQRILSTLFERGRIDADTYRQALASDLRIVEKPRRRDDAMHAVLHWSELAAGRNEPIVRATIDLDVQSRVARILAKNVKRWHWRGAGNTAGLVVDSATGQVLAWVGSGDYFDEEGKGAIDYVRNKRSPGSALKPFVYALGLADRRLTAATELSDIRVEFPMQTGQAYLPRNITHTFLGPMLLREALANSRNIPALRVLAEVGVERAVEFFDKAGVSGVSFSPGRYGLGLALGNLHVTLEELVGLYGVLANGGKTLPLVHFLGEESAPSRQVLAADVAAQITHILGDPLARLPSFRRGSALEFDYAVAVKTGTSQGYRDAWAVGYSDRLLIGVWVGNHDWRRMNHLGGVTAAAGALHTIMDGLMPGHRPHVPVQISFAPPEGYAARSVCPLSGKVAGKECPNHRVEYFAPGTEPYESCPYHRKVEVDRRNGLLATGRCPERFVEERVLVDLPVRYEFWARAQHLELAPKQPSPLCGAAPDTRPPALAIAEPRDKARYLYDPDTPKEFSTIRLAARVWPRSEEIVWIIDGVPVAKVGYPHEFRWLIEKGRHVIEAAMVQRGKTARPITVTVAD